MVNFKKKHVVDFFSKSEIYYFLYYSSMLSLIA